MSRPYRNDCLYFLKGPFGLPCNENRGRSTVSVIDAPCHMLNHVNVYTCYHAVFIIRNQNKITVKVLDSANKTEIKLAVERIFQVKVEDVRVSNVRAKQTTRGTRYQGKLSGYKKAVVTIAEGEAIDLFKE